MRDEPRKKTGWRPKPRPAPLETSDDLQANPLDRLKKAIFHWLNTRLGLVGAAIILLPLTIWWQWDKIEKLPGVAYLVEKLDDLKSLPQASGKSFSIMLAKLENDKDGKHRTVIKEALSRYEGIELFVAPRMVSTEGNANVTEAIRSAHEHARKLLKESHADVMIWGTVLDTSKGDSPLSLHWTTSDKVGAKTTSEGYRPTESNYDLPDLFWSNLGDVLGLLVTAQAATFYPQQGQSVADRLQPFIERTRVLLASSKLTPDKLAAIKRPFADALIIYGEQRGDSNALIEAVAAFRDALKEYTRDRVPLGWAMTQNNLGGTLLSLGERESGNAHLDEAVTVLREELKERTRDRVPLDWAGTQNNLGLALQTLGEREIGTQRLDEAVTAYREALKEYTRERVPLDWAATQNNLGNAFSTLGEREGGTQRLDEAVTAYREALKEYTRERVPLDWAMTQSNLGTALQTLGERESGTQHLDEAVAAFRDALKEYTRDRAPLLWATTQDNLGRALTSIGKRKRDATSLEKAITILRDALQERARSNVPLKWAETQDNLGTALLNLGQENNDPQRIAAAVEAFHSALQEYTRDRAPIQFEKTTKNLASAKEALKHMASQK